MKAPSRGMRRSTPAALLLPLLVSLPARAQFESALLSKVAFNLTNPGGKSLAMGGAFTAIADDATAALANPAGLGLLSSVEAGVSGKRFDDLIGLVTARSTATGGLTSEYPVTRGVNSDIGRTRSGVEYAGVVLPVSKRFVAALTYAENLRFTGDPGADGYPYIELRDNRSGGLTRRDYLYEYRELGSVALTNRLFGLSAAYRVTDRVRVGAGLTLNRMTFALDGDAGGPHRIVSRTYLSPTSIETRTVFLAVSGFGGTVLGGVVGLHADVLPSGLLTVGAAYRQTGRSRGTLALGGDVPETLASQSSRAFSLTVPKDAALGLASQPLPGLTLAVEAQWVAYGDFAEPALQVVTYSGLAGPAPGVPVSGALVELERPRSGIVPRVGLEYVASAQDLLLAFRVGYHREAARGVRARLVARDGSGDEYPIDDPPFSSAIATVYDGGRPDDRFSGGIGATLSRRVSFDLAFDVGRSGRQLSVSVFSRF